MKHTPGPWQSFANMIYSTEGMVCELSEPHASPVVKHVPVAIGSPNRDEVRANGNLIIAAPDLLEACKTALDYLEWLAANRPETGTVALASLRAAIAKAEATA